ncbi:hypothetical protein ASE00_07690 [Sphingomonas sp. Root710]|nr:hypothetical protein ASE00_07690 [Sphingomonas sp. Root710]
MGWSGVLMLVASEASLFGYLLFSYYYCAATAQPGWVLEPRPALFPAIPSTIMLLASSFTALWAEKGVEKNNELQTLLGLGITFVLGAAFAAIQMHEWAGKSFRFATSPYASLYFTTTGFHMAHVLIGLVILLTMFGWTAAGFFSPRRRIVVSVGVLYWHFVDIVWLFVFTTYYLTPYLGFGL